VSSVGSAGFDDNSEVRLAPLARCKRLLVIEDNSLLASVLTSDLDEFGYSVVGPVGSLAEAIALASTSIFDGAIIDVELGEESALPVAQILSDRHIPFLFMTGLMERPEGAFHDVPTLEKPFTVEQLRCALQQLLPALEGIQPDLSSHQQ